MKFSRFCGIIETETMQKFTNPSHFRGRIFVFQALAENFQRRPTPLFCKRFRGPDSTAAYPPGYRPRQRTGCDTMFPSGAARLPKATKRASLLLCKRLRGYYTAAAETEGFGRRRSRRSFAPCKTGCDTCSRAEPSGSRRPQSGLRFCFSKRLRGYYSASAVSVRIQSAANGHRSPRQRTGCGTMFSKRSRRLQKAHSAFSFALQKASRLLYHLPAEKANLRWQDSHILYGLFPTV